MKLFFQGIITLEIAINLMLYFGIMLNMFEFGAVYACVMMIDWIIVNKFS